MSFMLEDVSVILNKENTETTELYYEQNLHSLAHYNHITPTYGIICYSCLIIVYLLLAILFVNG
jgi:hypothetical protein